MAKGLFHGAAIAIPCPDCGASQRRTLGWLQGQTQLTCAVCETEIRLDNDGLVRQLGRIDTAWERFRRFLAPQ